MKIFFLQHNRKKTLNLVSGFTLVEALVATSILAVVVTALLNVVGQNIFLSNYVKNKVTAISLAQEGVELVRNIQDSALLEQEFMTFEVFAGTVFLPCVFGDGACRIDPLDLQIQSCPGQECPPLLVSPNGYFNYSLGDADNTFNEMFTRTIFIEPTSSLSGRVTVRVDWMQGQSERSVEYETDLFLWIN